MMLATFMSAAILSISQPWDLRVEPENRVSLPAGQAQRLLTHWDLGVPLIATSTSTIRLLRDSVEACESARLADQTETRNAILGLKPTWYESPVLWFAAGVVTAGLVSVTALSVGASTR